jgi:hypothetical protein
MNDRDGDRAEAVQEIASRARSSTREKAGNLEQFNHGIQELRSLLRAETTACARVNGIIIDRAAAGYRVVL